MVKISGGVAGSIDRMKREMVKGSGGGTWIRGLKSGEDLTVRFLTEPEEWFAYREHFDPDVKFFPCIGKSNNCPGCYHESEKVSRTSRRYLANVLDVTSGAVVPLKLPLDLANRLVVRYERNNNTLRNRDYTLHRMGQALDTTYDVTPEDKTNIDTSRFDLLDLEAVLVEQYEDAFPGGGSSEEDDIPSEPSPRTEAPTHEVDDDSGQDDGYMTEEEALQLSKDELKNLADSVGVQIDKRWAKEKIVDAIFSAAG